MKYICCFYYYKSKTPTLVSVFFFYSRERVLSAMFHRLIVIIEIRWQATRTRKINPNAKNTTGQERTNGYVCELEEHKLNKI